MTNPRAFITRIDCTLYDDPEAKRRAMVLAIKHDPDMVVFHQPRLDEGWLELIRTAYESGHDVQVSQVAAPA